MRPRYRETIGINVALDLTTLRSGEPRRLHGKYGMENQVLTAIESFLHYREAYPAYSVDFGPWVSFLEQLPLRCTDGSPT